jgi:hypothetical protein
MKNRELEQTVKTQQAIGQKDGKMKVKVFNFEQWTTPTSSVVEGEFDLLYGDLLFRGCHYFRIDTEKNGAFDFPRITHYGQSVDFIEIVGDSIGLNHEIVSQIENGPMKDDPLLREMKRENDPGSDEIRLGKRKVKLTNQQIIELAYICKDVAEVVARNNTKLTFEAANCYGSCYHTVQKLLKSVDSKYVKAHGGIKEFYRKDRELSNDWDRVRPGQ